jgi:hypothetical protein
MSQDLSGIHKPRSSLSLTQNVGHTTHTRAVGQSDSTDSNRHFQNPHDDKNWDSYTPSLRTASPQDIAVPNTDEPLLLSMNALQAMLEDMQNPQFSHPNEQALWLSRLLLLRKRGWANITWHNTETLPQLLQRLWREVEGHKV